MTEAELLTQSNLWLDEWRGELGEAPQLQIMKFTREPTASSSSQQTNDVQNNTECSATTIKRIQPFPAVLPWSVLLNPPFDISPTLQIVVYPYNCCRP
jgi:hypothetical protein